MGIQGLIPFLEKASKPTNISEFSGGTAVIDAYCWLHKGVFSCAEKIARGEDSDLYVSYCMKFVNMLLAKNVKPILVFDGQRLPAKMETEEKRRESREVNRKRAAELMRLDRSKEALTYLRRCVDITHEMALNLIRVCRSRNIDCVVAPYEADAQLAFLNMQNLADVVITEDSDLLLFGAKKVLFKMDMNGNGLLVEQSKLHIAMGVKENDFSLDKFRYMCILSGCDYLSSLPGIGLVKASRFIKRTADPDIYRSLTRLSLHLNMPQLCVTQEYRNKFMDADFMFKYQPVYDPRERRLRPLNDLDEEDENYAKYKNFINVNSLSEEQLKNLAYGNLDPFKLTQMDSWSPSKVPVTEVSRKVGWNTPNVARYPSIWCENYEPNSWTKPKVEPPNALRPSVATKTSGESSSVVGDSDKRRLPMSKKIVLPKANLDVEFENFDNKYSPIIDDSSDDNTEERTTPRNEDEPSSSLTRSAIALPKKTHHNPFLRSSLSTSTARKNTSMLDKLQRLCHSTKDDTKEKCSRYFGGDAVVATNVSPEICTISNQDHDESSSTSPVISVRPKKSKIPLNFEDGTAKEQRSPLKTLNASPDETQNDMRVISQKYSIPTSGNENDFQRLKTDKEQQKIESPRKRTIPFAITSAEKKPRVPGFLEKLNSFRRCSTNSSFVWSQPEEDSGETALNIGHSTMVGLDFKKPVVGCKIASIHNSDKVLSQPSDEDEGFCSPNSFESDVGAESGTECSSYTSSPVKKLSWVSCRMSGLKKSGSKQLSLDQYAFKSAVKMKR